MAAVSKLDHGSAGLAFQTRRRLARIGWAAGIAGALVVFSAIGLFSPLFANANQNTKGALLNGPLVVAYVAIAGVTINLLMSRHLNQALAWMRTERPPDEREHRMTLHLATRAVAMSAMAWVTGALVFAILNGSVYAWGFAAVVGATIWLGGETTCALEYLLYERALRPVLACALAARPTTTTVAPGVRMRLAMAWMLGTGVPLVGVLVVGIVGVTKSGVHTAYIASAVLFLAAVALAAGLLATLTAARAIADPLLAVRKGLERIEAGDLDVHVRVDDGSEVGLLQAGFNRMVGGLHERERIRDLFGRQVGAEVARAALSEGIRLGGEEREVGALFVDLVGSTSLALQLPATDVVRLLNQFFHVVVEVVERGGGIVNKFEGDAALCVFGAPVVRQDPAADALRAARELAARLSHELPEIDFGIGVSAGAAVAGNVGAEHRFEYTVIGDPVNEAARLAELAKQRAERVLASDRALARASEGESAAWSVTEAAVLRGRGAPTRLARPLRR